LPVCSLSFTSRDCRKNHFIDTDVSNYVVLFEANCMDMVLLLQFRLTVLHNERVCSGSCMGIGPHDVREGPWCKLWRIRRTWCYGSLDKCNVVDDVR